MGNFSRDDNRGGGYRGGGGRSFGGGGRSSFGGGRGFDRGESRGDRPMFTATCSDCGKECQVPFRPTNGKPVYCSECFEKKNGGSDSRRFDDRGRAPQAQGGVDLSAINAKLDKILKILEPKVVAPVTPAPVAKVEKIADKVDLPKIKKAIKKAASTKKG